MKPPSDEAAKFITALKSRGWEIRGDLIYSEADYLHFPYPDGWMDDLNDLEQLMRRRRARFMDAEQEGHLDIDMRERLIRVHSQALDAICEVRYS